MHVNAERNMPRPFGGGADLSSASIWGYLFIVTDFAFAQADRRRERGRGGAEMEDERGRERERERERNN